MVNAEKLSQNRTTATDKLADKRVVKNRVQSKTVNSRKRESTRRTGRTTKAGTRAAHKAEKINTAKHISEGVAFKNQNNKRGKNRIPVWVSKTVLEYEKELKKLQIELLKMQNHVKAEGLRIAILFEGRDAAGKGGTIKRMTEHLNPRGARVVALEKPSDREATQWYFQRYTTHLPSAGEIVFFDRSWYNRAMVEPVMGFCTDEQNKRFLKYVPLFEQILVKEGIILSKFYFSVSKKVQLKRFQARETDPLKLYKISPVDRFAQEYWNQYTIRKFQMLTETNRTRTPWTIIRSDNKKRARINCIKYFLSTLEYKGKLPTENFKYAPDIAISGIEEIKLMEEGLLSPDTLPG